MTISPEQFFFGLLALIGVTLIIGALWALISLLLAVGKSAAATGLQAFAGIAVGVLVDVRVMYLLASNLTLLAYYQGGSWRHLATAFALETFSLSALYIVLFLSIDIKREKPVGKVAKEILDAVKAGAGFWGLTGATLSFSMSCFLISTVWNIPSFNGDPDGRLGFFEATRFALQCVLDMVPINLDKSFGISISKVSVAPGSYAVGALVFVYQILLLLSLVRVVVHFWQMRKPPA